MNTQIEVKSNIIKLGKSNVSQKVYILKSILKLSHHFISFPFGSTRTRFQKQELFDYELKTIDKFDNNENYHYLLTVTKKQINSKNCPHCIKYFCNDGWDHDLIVLNITTKNVEHSFLSLEEIEQMIPENYGNVELSVQQSYIKPTIGIVSPIYSRHEYLEKFLNSLSKSNLLNCILVLVDESMTKDINNDKIKVRELVKNYKNENTTLIKIYKNKHGNMFDSILTGFDLLAPLCNYLVTIDSDTIHNTDWIKKCVDTFDIVKSEIQHSNILLSGFNTTNLGKHTVKEYRDEYVIKDSVGGCQMFFDKSIYYEFIRKALISHKWDSNILSVMNDIDGSIITTKPSVIEHIGYESSMQKENVYDYSVDFED